MRKDTKLYSNTNQGKPNTDKLLERGALNKYLEEKIFPQLQRKAARKSFYVHTNVQRREHFLRIATLRSVYEALPVNVKENSRLPRYLRSFSSADILSSGWILLKPNTIPSLSQYGSSALRLEYREKNRSTS
uniref:Uncharacterized protein n=1 Tax=Nelumbo nucifera TaxID=4432 RepID=A0A822YJA4_NELNU|nr:TPA_asm: hypothetical protein HUJ06_011423 [Nelumbo nucifera]